MRKTVLLLIITCTLMVNFSFVGTRVAQVCAQAISVVTSVISVNSGSDSSSSEDGEGKYKTEECTGNRDCHDELVYYYMWVDMPDGTRGKQYVGCMEIKFGQVKQAPPTQYDLSEPQYYSKNVHYARRICVGESTSVPCAPKFLSCEEQNP